MKLFFSYGHDKNTPIVDRLRNDLVNIHNYYIWIDKYEIKSGDDWRNSIINGIKESSLLLAFASKHSIRDPGVCIDELTIAVSLKGNQVLSVILEKDIIPPAYISYRHYIDMSDWNNWYDEITNSFIENDEFKNWYYKKLGEILDVLKSPDTEKYIQEMDFIRNYLHPTMLLPKRMKKDNNYYCGREWLRALVEEWIQNGKNNILVITGGPGSGKTAFVSQEFINNKDVHSAIYCEWDNDYTNNINSVSRSIAYQIASRAADYRNIIYTQLNNNTNEYNEDLFKNLVLTPLQELTIDGNRSPMLLLIDGLDEIENKQTNEYSISEILGREAEFIPSWVKIIITTRNNPSVINPLSLYDKINLDDHYNDAVNDIKYYISHRISKMIYHSSTDLDIITESILKKSGNIFLVAKALCDEFENNKISLTELNKIPDSLNGIYYRYFDRIYRSSDMSDDEYSAICALSFTKTPIPFDVLKIGVGWNNRQIGIFIEKYQQYLTDSKDYLSFYHKSLVDWLTSKNAGKYMADEETGMDIIRKGVYKIYKKTPADMFSDYIIYYLLDVIKEKRNELFGEVINDFELADKLLDLAKTNISLFEFEKVIEYTNGALSIYLKSIKDSNLNNICTTYILLVQALVRLFQLNTAENRCLEGIQFIENNLISIKNTTPKTYAKILNLLADIYERKSDWKKAEFYYLKSKNEYLKIGERFEAIDILNTLALMFRVTKNIEDALLIYKEVEQIIPLHNLEKENVALFMVVMMNKGWCLHSATKYAEAKKHLNKCINLHELYPNILRNRDIAQLFYLLSIIEYNDANYQAGLKHADKAIKYVKLAYGDKTIEVCSAMNEKGFILLKLGRNMEAYECFKRTYTLRKNKLGEEDLYTTISLRNVAKVEMLSTDCEDINNAKEHFEKILSIRKRIFIDNPINGYIASSYLDLAELYLQLKEYKLALKHGTEALNLYMQIKSERHIGISKMILGKIYKEIAQKEKAMALLSEALDCQRQFYNDDHPYIQNILDIIETL